MTDDVAHKTKTTAAAPDDAGTASQPHSLSSPSPADGDPFAEFDDLFPDIPNALDALEPRDRETLARLRAALGSMSGDDGFEDVLHPSASPLH